ncbi:cadmium resistance transporter [Leptolyngbya sp. FACHB-541]|uniref:cadmium resistance transporter n=1 Tax=Leptolyngbya sp. FACHB-541 TaxID=2692810 RepID=UPI00168525C5|nr:cadmium resistance transporter [Leptolyngbya sp. FACHB-541]MBD1998008.1 cadmium resistance transporter [Leptolyngbya sp. FACHB-541]
MGWIVQAITTGIAAFAATNIDDIIILMLFFAQVNAILRPYHIVTGQYLGFLVLILASLPGFIGGLLIPRAWIGLLGILPIIIGVSQLLNRDKPDTDVQTLSHQPGSTSERSPSSKLAALLTPQTYSVAAVTLANGGDNIGIYVPLFASCDLPMLLLILTVFFVLIGVWCYVAYRLARFPAIAHLLTRYGRAIVPFVLIGLGMFILLESKTYQLFTSAPLF